MKNEAAAPRRNNRSAPATEIIRLALPFQASDAIFPIKYHHIVATIPTTMTREVLSLATSGKETGRSTQKSGFPPLAILSPNTAVVRKRMM